MSVSERLNVVISDVLGRPGATKAVRIRQEVPGLALGLARVPEGTALVGELRLDAVVEGIHVSGTVGGEAVFECRRCLAPGRVPFSVEVSEVFAEEPEPDVYAMDEDHIDLEPMLVDVVLSVLPTDPLCREDCRGLCQVCGEDRNMVACGHTGPEASDAWGQLRDLDAARARRRTED